MKKKNVCSNESPKSYITPARVKDEDICVFQVFKPYFDFNCASLKASNNTVYALPIPCFAALLQPELVQAAASLHLLEMPN